MKLKTMLLPTGEFALIASECPSTDTDDALRGFRELIGAAAVLITDEEVDVEDAIFDPEARRAKPKFTELTVEQLEAHLGVRLGREYIAATRAVMEDREVSPAGLIKGQPGDPDFMRDPNFVKGGESGADPEPDGVLVGDGDEMGRPAEPQIGDTVRIIEVCGGNREPYMKYVGVAGEVAAIDPPTTRLGETYWVKTAELDGIWATKVEVISDGR